MVIHVCATHATDSIEARQMRRLTNTFGAIAAALIWVGVGGAQDLPAPDFSGTWVLEQAGGDLPERAVKALTKGSAQPVTLAISQTNTELRVTRETGKGTVDLVFPLSGSETTQQTPHGPMTSRTAWRGPTLVSTGKRPLPGPFPFGTRSVEFTETRSLSADGTRLTIDIQFKTPRGVKTRTARFRRSR